MENATGSVFENEAWIINADQHGKELYKRDTTNIPINCFDEIEVVSDGVAAMPVLIKPINTMFIKMS